MRLILSVLLAAAAASAGANEVYRSIAPDGTVIYSDRPTGADAAPIALNVSSPSPPAGSGSTPSSPGRPSRDDAASSSSDEPSEPSAAEREAQRQRNCELAQERAESYSNANRLYRELPDGEREYLDADEIDAARARAAADVETWCS